MAPTERLRNLVRLDWGALKEMGPAQNAIGGETRKLAVSQQRITIPHRRHPDPSPISPRPRTAREVRVDSMARP